MSLTHKHRIVSLLPSATEIICKLGLQDDLIARSHECDYPVGVERLPIVTKPKLNPHGTSGGIHQQVTEILTSALSVYEVDAAALRELQPTHIVTQVQCEVCAVSMKDVEAAIAAGLENKPHIIPLNPMDLDSVFYDIQRTADALHKAECGEEVIREMRDAMAAVAVRSASCGHKPTVACIEWLSPLMTVGNWMPELVKMAGGINLLGEAGKHSPFISWDEFIQSQPEIIVVLPCGFSLDKVISEIHLLTDHEAWNEIPAVKNKKVYLCDGHQYFNRPGPRLLDSLEILAEILHPDVFPPKYMNHAYRKMDELKNSG